LTKKSKAASRDRLTRLFLLADEKLQVLEKRQREAVLDLTAADNEKDAKAMIALTTLYEKLVGMKDKEAARKEAARKEDVRSDKAERICIDLARRIEKLQQERETKISAKPEQK